jgi:hypothetical protein
MQESKDVDREKPVEDDAMNAGNEFLGDLEPDQDTSTKIAGGLNPQPFPPLES